MFDARTDLYTPTPPTESDWYWVKHTITSAPEVAYFSMPDSWWFVSHNRSEVPAMYGPRIPQPVAPPVECWLCEDAHGLRFMLYDKRDADRARADDCIVVRGVFVPTEVCDG